ncbi:rbm25 protein [Culex quinquefasciatus]|uniref:Rbm25 protein n=1 Tax=Culex quinquefasciatus TaxID=7176 RepID=B0X088_CULQU|nr:rbm25 protein [Culex quinquefasciatus]|eukprot:XP_001863060.1 rbm25 protein [Culex quinquefasciatus]
MDGTISTIFIGNINNKAPEPMIKKMMASCGTVINWKRVSSLGSTSSGAVTGARAVRMLHDMDIDGKKLVAKVDALLDDHKKEAQSVNRTRHNVRRRRSFLRHPDGLR